MPRQGDDFARQGYAPSLGDVVHLDWAPAIGHEMRGPHYGLVVSDTRYNHGTGLVVLCPITSNVGKLSHFEYPIQVGRVSGAVILSELRSVDYQTRSIQFEDAVSATVIAEANRRIRMIFP